MKLWFTSDTDWDAARCRYAAEQMLFTLFPGERAEYPDSPAPKRIDGDGVIFTLQRGEKISGIAALLFRGGESFRGLSRFLSAKLDEDETRLYHTLSRAVKQSFYLAGRRYLGRDLPWGSLTGVRPTKLPTAAIFDGASAKRAKSELIKRYFVSPERAELAVECASHSVKARRGLEPNDIALYIGIPFCPTRCAYCSFVSQSVERSMGLVEPFMGALFDEITACAALVRELSLRVEAVYIGGGTPTTLSPSQLASLLDSLENKFDLSAVTEVTLEAGRPDTITREKLEAVRDHVTRVSVNPQSMSDNVLAAIGRRHTAEDIVSAFRLVRETLPDVEINMDLIAGLPADTAEGFSSSLETLIALSPENITVHTLALKRGSRITEEGSARPGKDEVAGMLRAASPMLRKAGYSPYYLYRQKYMSGSFENVGWAKPGTVGLYNILIMEELCTILAMGGGGSTKLVDMAGGRVARLFDPKYPKEYIEEINRVIAAKEDKVRAFYGEGTR